MYRKKLFSNVEYHFFVSRNVLRKNRPCRVWAPKLGSGGPTNYCLLLPLPSKVFN